MKLSKTALSLVLCSSLLLAMLQSQAQTTPEFMPTWVVGQQPADGIINIPYSYTLTGKIQSNIPDDMIVDSFSLSKDHTCGFLQLDKDTNTLQGLPTQSGSCTIGVMVTSGLTGATKSLMQNITVSNAFYPIWTTNPPPLSQAQYGSYYAVNVTLLVKSNIPNDILDQPYRLTADSTCGSWLKQQPGSNVLSGTPRNPELDPSPCTIMLSVTSDKTKMVQAVQSAIIINPKS